MIYLLGFGMPALQIPRAPDSRRSSGRWWRLVLSYSAYVAEVYRAGIESVHPSQTAAARSLGLSRWQTLRFVVIPQAVRRVIPPLLNDFIGLQKDTALVAVVAGTSPEAFLNRRSTRPPTFNFTPFVGAALCFLVITLAADAVHGLAARARQRRRRQAGAAV